jgi:hypothetical protein
MDTRRFLRHAPLLLVVLIGGIAIAQSATTGRVFPYIGYLEEDGFPVDGTRDIRIELFSSEVAGSACDTQDFDDEPIASGRFQVELIDVPDNCLVTGELFADVWVGPDFANLVDLGTGVGLGRVRVGAVPFAAASARAATLLVEEDANVGGNLDVTGDALVGGNTSTDTLDVTSNTTAALDVTGNARMGSLDVTNGARAASFDASGDVYWSGGGWLRNDQGGSIELGNTGTPYIDFSNDNASDYDARLRLANNDVLIVEGARLNATLAPAYDSGWQFIAAASTTYTWNHNLGAIPTRVVWLASNVNPNANADAWVQQVQMSSRADGYTSPESTWFNRNQVQWRKYGGDNIVWCDNGENPCPPGAAASTSGYMRLLLWR